MFQPRKYKKQELLEIFRTRNDNALIALIDALWREYPAQWQEQKLSLGDLDKTDSEHVDYDPRYVYAKNNFKNADGSQTTSYATANGFGHVVRADFAQVFGFFNYALSFMQTVVGPYGKIPENQTADAWVNTDLLFTLCNGKDADNRSNALEIFKSGLVKWHNAQVIGAYEHGNEGEPAPDLIPGLIQYTAENGFECVKEDLLWHPFGESAYEIAVRNGFVGTEAEWLASLKGADGEDGAAGDDAPDKFIALTDTPASYPATVRGQLVRHSAAQAVDFANKIGDDATGPWIGTGASRILGANLFSAGFANFTSGISYQVTVVISGMTTGTATLAIDGVDVATFDQSGAHQVTYIATSTGSLSVAVTGDVSFDGTVDSIAVQEITVSQGAGLRFLDENYSLLTSLKVWIDDYQKKRFSIEGLSGDEDGNVTVDNELTAALLKLTGELQRYNETLEAFEKVHTDHLLNSIIQAAATGQIPKIIETGGVKSIEWGSVPASVPGTETLSGTSVTVSWNTATTATLALTGATTISFGTIQNYVKRIFVSGNYSLTLPGTCKIISGEYDGAVDNVIDLIPQPSGAVWVTINQEG